MAEAVRTPADVGVDESDLPDALDPEYARVADRRPDRFLGRLKNTGLRYVAYYRPQQGRWDVYKGQTVGGEVIISTRRVAKLDAGGPDGDIPPYDHVLQRYLWKRTAGYTGDEPFMVRLLMAFLNAIMAAWYTLAGRPFRFQRYRSQNYDPDLTDDTHV